MEEKEPFLDKELDYAVKGLTPEQSSEYHRRLDKMRLKRRNVSVEERWQIIEGVKTGKVVSEPRESRSDKKPKKGSVFPEGYTPPSDEFVLPMGGVPRGDRD